MLSFLRWLWMIISRVGLAAGCAFLVLVLANGFEASIDDVRRLVADVRCAMMAGRGVAAYIIAMAAGLTVMILGQSKRLRQKYLTRAFVAYAFGIVAMALIFSFDETGQPTITCAG